MKKILFLFLLLSSLNAQSKQNKAKPEALHLKQLLAKSKQQTRYAYTASIPTTELVVYFCEWDDQLQDFVAIPVPEDKAGMLALLTPKLGLPLREKDYPDGTDMEDEPYEGIYWDLGIRFLYYLINDKSPGQIEITSPIPFDNSDSGIGKTPFFAVGKEQKIMVGWTTHTLMDNVNNKIPRRYPEKYDEYTAYGKVQYVIPIEYNGRVSDDTFSIEATKPDKYPPNEMITSILINTK
jgi:hypothetical protein